MNATNTRTEPIVCDHLVAELRRVLKDKFGASSDVIDDVIWFLRQDTIESHAQPLHDLPLRDPADVAIVSSALNAAADALVTGDKEILSLHRVGKLEILTPVSFGTWKEVNSGVHDIADGAAITRMLDGFGRKVVMQPK